MYHIFVYSIILLIKWFLIYIYTDFQFSKSWILFVFLVVLHQFGIVAQNMTFIWFWLKSHTMKDRLTRNCLATSLYLLKKSWNFIYISDTESFTTCYKISSGSYSNKSGIKAILLQALLVRFLLTKLSSKLPDGICFYDMINHALEPLVILEIHGDINKESYIWFEILKVRNPYLLNI